MLDTWVDSVASSSERLKCSSFDPQRVPIRDISIEKWSDGILSYLGSTDSTREGMHMTTWQTTYIYLMSLEIWNRLFLSMYADTADAQ